MNDIKECANPACKDAAKGRGATCGKDKCRKAVSRAKSQKLEEKTCLTCSLPFVPVRADQDHCDSKCQNRAYNASRSADAFAQYNREVYELSDRLAEMYYTSHPDNREQLIVDIINCAKNGNMRYRKMLTFPELKKPDTSRTRLFYRNCPSQYKTISEIVNQYCIASYNLCVDKFLASDHKDLSILGYDTIMFDQRGYYRRMVAGTANSIATACASQVIDEKMNDRKTWVKDYYKQVIGVSI